MIEFLIKLYLAFMIIDTGLALLYHQLMKRKLETKAIDEIIQEQMEAEEELIDEIRSTGKTQEEVDKIIDFICNNIELIRILLIIIPIVNIIAFFGLMRSISEVMGS